MSTPASKTSKRPVAIVTGANHGIGAAIASRLAADGTAVVATYFPAVVATYFPMEPRNDPKDPAAYDAARSQDATCLVEQIRATGGEILGVEADLSSPDAPGEIFDAAEAAWGPVSILINNASAWVPDTFLATDTDRMGRGLTQVNAATFDHNFAVDARATALLIAEFAHRFTGDYGRIVTMTSGGASGWPEEVTYAAAKRAGESYTLSAALELATRGVTANCVHPPPTDTGWISEASRAAIEADGLRIALPNEIADVVAWLCSHQASGVSGNVIQMR